MTLLQFSALKRGDKVRRISRMPALTYVVIVQIDGTWLAVNAGLFPPTAVTAALVGVEPRKRFTPVATIEKSGWIIGAEVVLVARAEDWELVS